MGNQYEEFKNEFITQLSTRYTPEDILIIMKKLNETAYNYDISKKSTEIAVIDYAMPKMVKEYLIVKRIEGLSHLTLEAYKMILEKFFCDIRKAPEEVEKNDIMVWIYRYQESNGISDRTLDKYREYICRFFSWATDEGYLAQNPAKTIRPIRYEVKHKEALTQLEMEYIRRACITVRERAMIEVLYSTGCRVSELAIIKLKDINWGNREIHLFGKGKKHRTAFFTARAEVILRDYLSQREADNEYLFVSERKPHNKLGKTGIERIIRVIADRANINKTVTPHIFRHTLATHSVYSGIPIEDVSKLLGHAQVNTTMVYYKAELSKLKQEYSRCII